MWVFLCIVVLCKLWGEGTALTTEPPLSQNSQATCAHFWPGLCIKWNVKLRGTHTLTGCNLNILRFKYCFNLRVIHRYPWFEWSCQHANFTTPRRLATAQCHSCRWNTWATVPRPGHLGYSLSRPRSDWTNSQEQKVKCPKCPPQKPPRQGSQDIRQDIPSFVFIRLHSCRLHSSKCHHFGHEVMNRWRDDSGSQSEIQVLLQNP